MIYYKVEKEIFDIVMKMLNNITMRDLDDWGISRTDGFLMYTVYEDWEAKRLKTEEIK